MEFKDKLKQLRRSRNMSQQELANAIYVSRSAVAKWENGLGLPNPEAMAALERFFNIDPEAIATEEAETVIVNKNRKLHLLCQIIVWTTMVGCMIIMSMLPFAIHKGSYGFTPAMAARYYADREYIDTGDYRIYYFTFEGDWEDGRHWSDLQGFRPVQKHFWGCTFSEEDYNYRVITKDSYVVCLLYTIKGKNGYYNLIRKSGRYKVSEQLGSTIWDLPAELITATSVTVSGADYVLQNGFFFITPEPVENFKIGDAWYNVE